MGRDLHAHLEYYDKEAGIWEGLAQFHFKRHRKLFDILLQNANGLPDFSVNPLSLSTVSLEIWSARQDDNRRLGIHHEGHLNYHELSKIFMAFVLDKVDIPLEFRALLDAAEVFYLREIDIRFVYWFDN